MFRLSRQVMQPYECRYLGLVRARDTEMHAILHCWEYDALMRQFAELFQ